MTVIDGLGRLESLVDAVEALRRFVMVSREYVPDDLLAPARTVVGRAGERLSLSRDHTVVALAGATGGGKSSLFNVLAGIELSTVGVRRPTTGAAHACVWGAGSASELLDWLGVARALRPVRRLRVAARPRPARPARLRLRGGLPSARGRPPARPRGPRGVGARPAEVRRQGGAQAVPGTVPPAPRHHRRRPQSVRRATAGRPAAVPGRPAAAARGGRTRRRARPRDVGRGLAGHRTVARGY